MFPGVAAMVIREHVYGAEGLWFEASSSPFWMSSICPHRSKWVPPGLNLGAKCCKEKELITLPLHVMALYGTSLDNCVACLGSYDCS